MAKQKATDFCFFFNVKKKDQKSSRNLLLPLKIQDLAKKEEMIDFR